MNSIFIASPKRAQALEILVHCVVWGYIFLSPLFFNRGGVDDINWRHVLFATTWNVATCFVFYVNYFFLIPRYFMHHKYGYYLVFNIILVVGLVVGLELFSHWYNSIWQSPRRHVRGRGFPPPSFSRFLLFKSYFWIQSAFSFLVSAAISLALKLSLRWHTSEMARRQAEVDRQAAELMNLKNQISPHFLLNTLNNIYALTSFNSEKAQQAILDLSKLLRYLLYENQNERVSLRQEAEFLQNYVALMSLRVGKNVTVKMDFNLQYADNVYVAPLLFISLVENAFKHGVSNTQSCLIQLSLQVDTEGKIVFDCRNTNVPKTSDDKSGGGIGLHQVRRRLDLAYPNNYVWEMGVEGDIYFSHIEVRNLAVEAASAKV